MYIPDVVVHEPESLEQAAELLVRHGSAARILAGGTDLLVDLKTQRADAAHLVSVLRIELMRGVTRAGSDLRIGALTTITELNQSPLVTGKFEPILDAARQMAAVQVRNLATVGGNVASAVPCADLPPIFMVMNAGVQVWSRSGVRCIPLDRFFVGPRRTVLQAGEVIVSIEVPTPERRSGAAYSRLALRDGNAIAVAGVAARVLLGEDGRIADARIALGAVAPTPRLVETASAALRGRILDEAALTRAAAAAMQAAQPISDVRGSADYRREVVGVLTRRALLGALRRAGD